MSSDDPKRLAQLIIDDLWTQHNADIIPEIFTEDAVYRDIGWSLLYTGHKEIAEYLDKCTIIIPDFAMELDRVIDVGYNVVGTNWHYSGTFRFGKQRSPFRLPGMSVLTLRDGKVAQVFDYYSAQDYLDAIDFPDDNVESFNARLAAAAERKKQKLAAASEKAFTDQLESAKEEALQKLGQ